MKVPGLKKEIEKNEKLLHEIQDFLNQEISENEEVKRLENNWEHLKKVKKTIEVMDKYGRLKPCCISNSAKEVRVRGGEWGYGVETEKKGLFPPNSLKCREESFAITNYYPWVGIKFLNLWLRKKEAIYLSIEYVYSQNEIDIKSLEGKKIYITADVLIICKGKEFILSECSFYIPFLEQKGESIPLILEVDESFLIQIDSVKLFLIEIEIVGESILQFPGIYVDSGLMSYELSQYRKSTGLEEAVRIPENFVEGRVDSFGIVQDL